MKRVLFPYVLFTARFRLLPRFNLFASAYRLNINFHLNYFGIII